MSVRKQGPCFTAIEESGGDKRFLSLNSRGKLIVSFCQILANLAIAVVAEAILMRISAEQVPSLHKVAPRYLKLVISSNFWPFLLISSLMAGNLRFADDIALTGGSNGELNTSPTDSITEQGHMERK